MGAPSSSGASAFADGIIPAKHTHAQSTQAILRKKQAMPFPPSMLSPWAKARNINLSMARFQRSIHELLYHSAFIKRGCPSNIPLQKSAEKRNCP
jgi:hypothetical protein